MDETSRIKKLFADHFDGTPWLDVTIVDTLKNISAKQAAQKIGDLNSIWQIVNHMIAWRETNLKRLKDEIISVPGNNFFEEVADTSEKAWQATLKKLEHSQHTILSFLTETNNLNFDRIYVANGNSYYEHLHGILQHDGYHLGQIVILKKLVK